MTYKKLPLLIFTSLSATAVAEEPQELEPIIISAPLHKKFAETVHPVNVLSGDDLALKQATTGT